MSDTWVESYAGAAEKWLPTEKGDSLVGSYEGWEEVRMEDIDETLRYYKIKDDAGDSWLVPNSYQIVKCFAGVEFGTRVKLVYKGELDLGQKGKSPMKNYSLMVAK